MYSFMYYKFAFCADTNVPVVREEKKVYTKQSETVAINTGTLPLTPHCVINADEGMSKFQTVYRGIVITVLYPGLILGWISKLHLKHRVVTLAILTIDFNNLLIIPDRIANKAMKHQNIFMVIFAASRMLNDLTV